MHSISLNQPEAPACIAQSAKPSVTNWPVGNDRHQQIREVALALFVKQGYGNVSLRQLAAPLGLRAGSLYHHLESKQALLFDLISEHLQNLLDSATWEVSRAPETTTQLRAFIATHIDFHIRHQSLALLSNLEMRSLECANQEEIKSLLKHYRECLAGILASGMKAGLFQTQPIVSAVQGVLAMLSGIAFWFDEQAAGQSPPLNHEQLTRQFTRMVFGALGAAPELIERLAP